MDDLNPLVICRTFGTIMKHTKRPGFGPLGLLHAQNQVLAQYPKLGEQISFAPSVDKMIHRAFEECRKGYPLDRMLAEPNLVTRFLKRARQLGVVAPDHAIILRVFRFRKDEKLKKYKLAKPTAPKEPVRDLSACMFAAEAGIAQMRYRYGASVDDILAYPHIGREFDEWCASLCPSFQPLDYRLAALRIRKSQYCKKEERTLFHSLREKWADKTLTKLESLDRLDLKKLENTEGIVGLVEDGRDEKFIYLAQTKDAAATLKPIARKDTLELLGNSFWHPSLSTIRVYHYNIGARFRNAPRSMWIKRLIRDKEPIFNAPITA